MRVQELEEMGVPVDSVNIRYSPFSRTTETAREVARVLGIPFESPSCQVSLVLPWMLKLRSVCNSSHFSLLAGCMHNHLNLRKSNIQVIFLGVGGGIWYVKDW
jgi:hypothetical protein